MATTAHTATSATLLDWAKAKDPNGKIAAVVELMSKENEILTDALWRPTNKTTTHLTTVRTGIPAGTWRKLYKGVDQEKSVRVQVEDGTGVLETWSTLDKLLVDLEEDANGFRLSEDRAFLEGLNVTMADTLFYGDVDADPEKFMGLTPRYSALSGVASAANVVTAAGATASAQTSLWLINWDELGTIGLFPKNTEAGFNVQDLGEETVYDENSKPYRAVRTMYQWKAGLCVRDWRQNVRICNINVASINGTGTADPGSASYTGPDLINLAVRAANKVRYPNRGRFVWYANRTVKTALDLLALRKASYQLGIREVSGEQVTYLRGIPVKLCDGIKDTEAVVS